MSDARSACSDLVAAFAHHVDHHEFARAVALFTEDAVFDRKGVVARGHAEIAAIWSDRPPSAVTRHLCYPPFFLEVGETHARAVTSLLVYMATHDGAGLPTAERPAVAEFHDTFRKTADGWRIAHRLGFPVLLTG